MDFIVSFFVNFLMNLAIAIILEVLKNNYIKNKNNKDNYNSPNSTNRYYLDKKYYIDKAKGGRHYYKSNSLKAKKLRSQSVNKK